MYATRRTDQRGDDISEDKTAVVTKIQSTNLTMHPSTQQETPYASQQQPGSRGIGQSQTNKQQTDTDRTDTQTDQRNNDTKIIENTSNEHRKTYHTQTHFRLLSSVYVARGGVSVYMERGAMGKGRKR